MEWMSDLISRSEVIELLYKVFDEYRIATDKTSTLGGFGSEVFKRVRKTPTVYDIDKVVEELKTDTSVKLYGSGNSDNYLIPVKRAIEIVKQGGVSDDVCEWRIVDRPHNLPIYNTSCGKIRLQYVTGVDIYCNGCGKKIKAVD